MEMHNRIYVPSFHDPYELQNCDVAISYPYKMISISYNITEILKEKDLNSNFDLDRLVSSLFLLRFPQATLQSKYF